MVNLLIDDPNEPCIVRSHGQVRLAYDEKSSRPDVLVILVDCELQHFTNASPSLQSETDSNSPKHIEWLEGGQESVRDFAVDLISHVLAPFSNVVCYFAGDLHGLSGIATLLAQQFVKAKAHNLPRSALPYILVVVDTGSAIFDPIIAQKRLQNLIKEAIEQRHKPTEACDNDCWHAGFRGIHVLGLQKAWDAHTRALKFRRQLTSLAHDVHWGRRTSRYLFSALHIDALLDRAISQLCLRPSTFNFLKASRPEQFTTHELQTHIDELLGLLPSQSWLWGFAIPLLSSALVVASYPPGSHCKTVSLA